MAVYHSWFTNQELPGIPFDHRDADGALVDLSTGDWTFSGLLVNPATNAIVATQSSDFTGAATSPNLTLNKWASGTLTAVTTDMGTTKTKVYELRVYLRRVADSADEVPMSTNPLRIEFKLAAA